MDHSTMDHSMMDHSHHTEPESTPTEYAKFSVIILLIILVGVIFDSLRVFMGTFFLVFGLFKLLDLKGFATSYIGYDIIAKRSLAYAYVYPFIELALAAGYFFAVPYTEWFTLFFMIVGSIGVFKELMRGSKIKCACLGTYIKLPLTTVSLIEDVAMGIMALLMILKVI